MKDEYKLLLGAIIVILIVLVGAYALSGSNNPPPAVSPTATPTTTPTPTAVPGSNGGTNGGTPSVTPSATPTATPVPTPTPEPESGVKLTEFGYWITYPPLGPQTWSEYKPGPANVVYFDPTSDDVSTIVYVGSSIAGKRGPCGETIVHRDGDLSGTVTVTIQASNDSNTWQVLPAIAPPYRYSYYVYGGENLTYKGGNIYTLKFGPGISEQTIYVPINDFWADSINVERTTLTPPQGMVKLTITGVDGGYSIGANKDFTVNINRPLPYVQFAYSSGSINGENCLVTHDEGIYNITIQVTRSGDPSQPLEVNRGYATNVPDGYLEIVTDDFEAGSATTDIHVYYNDSYTDEITPYLNLYLYPTESYYVGFPPQYNLGLILN